jgi:dynactin complex subunit
LRTKSAAKISKHKRVYDAEELISGKQYHWTEKEHKKYIKFLADHPRIFDLSSNTKKKKKIHVKMSNFIKERTPIQCRSHHQKMINRYGTVEGIMSTFGHLFRSQQKQSPPKENLEATSL